jgi:hypothetical protein
MELGEVSQTAADVVEQTAEETHRHVMHSVGHQGSRKWDATKLRPAAAPPVVTRVTVAVIQFE